MNEMMTTRTAAAIRGVAPVTVRHWCAQGKVPGAIRIGRDWLIPYDSRLPEIGAGGKRMHKHRR